MEEKNLINLQNQVKKELPENNEKSENPEGIIANIEELLKSTDITETNKDFKKNLIKWEQIKSQNLEIPDVLEKKFWKLTEQYKENYDWALWSNFKIKEEICSELEKIIENKENYIILDDFDNLRNKWKKIGNVPPEKSKELWQHYHALCKKIHEKTVKYFEENLKTKIVFCEKIEKLINPDNWQDATKFVKETQKKWNTIGLVLRKDSEEIWKRFQTACNTFFINQKKYYKDLKKAQKENLHKKQELCELIESFRNSKHWKETSRNIHDVQRQWKLIGSAGKKYESVIWKRFKAACDSFFNNQKEFFENLDEQRPLNYSEKEELCIKMEKMEHLSDEEKYKLIIKSQNQWKEIGPVQKELEKVLWERFRKPIDEYFNSRKEKYEKEKEIYEKNLKIKEQLCIEAEKCSNSNDLQAAKEHLIELQKKWNETGPVPKESERDIWNKFKTISDTFFERFKEHMNDFKQKLQENLKKKIDICFQVEIIAGLDVNSTDAEERAKWQLEKLSENFWYKVVEDESWESKANKIKELQHLWKEIGPVPKNKSQEVWERFQKACNWFFQNKKINH